MYFQNIKGHEELLDSFKSWLLQNYYRGVYLFEGPKGVGKYTTAKVLSRYLTCTGVKDDSCWCESCKLFPNIPDFLEITSDSNVIKLSDIEVVNSFVSLRPFKSKQKVILIDDAERLNGATSNQLLKIFEDLPSHIVIFLVSSCPERMISTILSRSKRINFYALYPETVSKILEEKGFTSKRLTEFKRMLPFLSQSVLANYEKYVSCTDQVQEFVLNFINKEEDDLLSVINSFDQTDDLIYFLEIFHIFINDILKVHFDNKNTVFNAENPQMMDRLTLAWKRDICLNALERIRPIILDYKKGLNIKLRTRVESLVSWIYFYIKKK
jgi:DNA polymerase III gamma/tau subunit